MPGNTLFPPRTRIRHDCGAVNSLATMSNFEQRGRLAIQL